MEIVTDLSALPERFTSKVQVLGPDDCWLWTAALSHDGYGVLWWEGGKRYAHRVAWEATHGPVAPSMVLDHTCFNRNCVNLVHLRVASKQQNCEYRSGPQRTSQSGARGVHWNARAQKWRVQVGHDGRMVSGGLFATVHEASEAAAALRARLHSHAS